MANSAESRTTVFFEIMKPNEEEQAPRQDDEVLEAAPREAPVAHEAAEADDAAAVDAVPVVHDMPVQRHEIDFLAQLADLLEDAPDALHDPERVS